MMDVGGDWQLQVKFLVGKATHALHLQQDAQQIHGRFRSQYGDQEVRGSIDDNGVVQLRSSVHFQACGAPYNFLGSFSGQVDGDSMSGQLSLGEFWTAEWRAERVAGA